MDDKSPLIFNDIFDAKDLADFKPEEEAYHQLMPDIMTQQKVSTGLTLNKEVKHIFVDGGFNNNPIYMNLLSKAFPHLEVIAAPMAQTSTLFSALAIHHCYNLKIIPSDIIELQYHNQSN